jgi:hypothetical protein
LMSVLQADDPATVARSIRPGPRIQAAMRGTDIQISCATRCDRRRATAQGARQRTRLPRSLPALSSALLIVGRPSAD